MFWALLSVITEFLIKNSIIKHSFIFVTWLFLLLLRKTSWKMLRKPGQILNCDISRTAWPKILDVSFFHWYQPADKVWTKNSDRWFTISKILGDLVWNDPIWRFFNDSILIFEPRLDSHTSLWKKIVHNILNLALSLTHSA